MLFDVLGMRRLDEVVVVLILALVLLRGRIIQLLAVLVFDDLSVHGFLADIFIVFVRLRALDCRRRYDGAVVPFGVGSLGLGDEGLIMLIYVRILLDRCRQDRLLVLPDVLRDSQLDERSR